ncbi:MAG: helix-turn-helix domain-containing protein [Nanoarchaeota archaeon]|nr:helix-turn-helix domain-containing protein [Nanoarchaeota archaeon]
MWQLKFEYKHLDCLYSSQIKKLGLTMYGYPLNNFLKEGKLHLTGIQILQGDNKKVKQYIKYLRHQKKIQQIELIAENSFFYEAVIDSNISYYQNLYHYQIFYSHPIIHCKGKEIFEVTSWNRELLEKIMNNVKYNKNTRYFKLLALKRTPTQKIFLPQILPKLTEKQQIVLKLAKERGYWKYPKEANLNQLAQELKIAKSTLHEILKRGEAKLIDFYM